MPRNRWQVRHGDGLIVSFNPLPQPKAEARCVVLMLFLGSYLAFGCGLNEMAKTTNKRHAKVELKACPDTCFRFPGRANHTSLKACEGGEPQ